MPPQFLAYSVILCFKKRRHKQKYYCSFKLKLFAPPSKACAGYVTGSNARAISIFCPDEDNCGPTQAYSQVLRYRGE